MVEKYSYIADRINICGASLTKGFFIYQEFFVYQERIFIIKKKLLLTNVSLFASTMAIMPISCASDNDKQKATIPICDSLDNDKHFKDLRNTTWDTEVKIQVKTPWADVKINQYAEKIKEEFNTLKSEDESLKNKPNINISIDKSTQDDKTLVQNVSSKKFDFAISSIASINNAEKSLITPKLQTLTNSFKFDKKWSYYKDGTSEDELIKTAVAQDALFKETPYVELSNITPSDWSGSIYKKFYNLDKKVNFYRGMIWIAGSDADILAIKKAWNDKDWTKFKGFGILHGDTTSGGKFKLQEKLLKKHFGDDAFTTLSEEIINSPNKFKNGKAKTMNNTIANYKIAFDDEGSFAWTKNEDKANNPTNFYNAENMSILTVTEPLKYDVGYYRSDFDLSQAKLLSKAIINLAEKSPSQDLYGPKIGYNGYQAINDIYEEVEKPYNKVING